MYTWCVCFDGKTTNTPITGKNTLHSYKAASRKDVILPSTEPLFFRNALKGLA